MIIYIPRSERGLATLLLCLILLAAATMLIFTLSRTSLFEQRIIGNEYRSETLHQACEAGLDYTRAWLRRHQPVWQLTANNDYRVLLPLPADNLGQADDLNLNLSVQRQDLIGPYLLLQVRARRRDSGGNDYVLRQFVHYTIIHGTADANGFLARVLGVPGTWHDHGDP